MLLTSSFPVSKLRIKERNPRKISPARMDLLKKSIADFPRMMTLRPMVYDPETMEVLGGNQRLTAIKALGMTHIPMEWVKSAADLTEDEKRRFILADNASFGEWDFDILREDWDLMEIHDWALDIDIPVPFDMSEYVPQEENIVTDIILGDLFQIGPHRLICGDSRDADIVKRVLDGETPKLMVTDPPYGVEYDPEWRARLGVNTNTGKMGRVENDDIIDWREAWALSPAHVAYVWHAGMYTAIVQESLKVCGFMTREQIIWAKDRFALSRGHYHWKHEPCWYAVKQDKGADWIGGHDQNTVWEIPAREDDGHGHGTQKPLECMYRPIINHRGDVYEPFCGSGTTIVASHKAGRHCFAIELKPEYCYISIQRMLALDPSLKILRNGKAYSLPDQGPSDPDRSTQATSAAV